MLNASQAARQLGVSAKALRIYEQRGLLAPWRTAAGYRGYNADDLAREAEIVALRVLGLSIAQVANAVNGDPQSLELALAVREANVADEIHQRLHILDKIRALRAKLNEGHASDAALITAQDRFRFALATQRERPPDL